MDKEGVTQTSTVSQNRGTDGRNVNAPASADPDDVFWLDEAVNVGHLVES